MPIQNKAWLYFISLKAYQNQLSQLITNKMTFYLAPIQGLTDWIFRESYHENIGHFDKCFSPFIRVENGEFFRPSQCKDITVEHNTFQKPVPQFLGNEASSFAIFDQYCTELGYTEVNINLGCPFTKVTNKGLGAGLLSSPLDIAQLLEQVFKQTKLQISVKCRLGQESTDEFEQLVPIFNAFPISELIIHPRTGKQLYKGDLHLDAFVKYAAQIKSPICFNGDIQSKDDFQKTQQLFTLDRVMLGRGILRNPFLLLELQGKELSKQEKVKQLRGFHLGMIERCKQKYSGDFSVIKRFEELWEYHSDYYEDGKKIFKQVKKSKTVAQYESVVIQAIQSIS